MKKKINYAEKDVLSDKDFESQNIKERITIWIDESTLDAFREREQKKKDLNQALINQALKEAKKNNLSLKESNVLNKKLVNKFFF